MNKETGRTVGNEVRPQRPCLLPTAYCLLPGRFRFWLLLFGALSTVGLGLSLPKEALADPHAVFYTDNGFKQVFYAVLAALNQADYVEPPRQPAIQTIQRLGDEIARTTNEPERVQLPRIRVRQVTSDDGDVFFREELWRRAEEKRAKVNVSITTCKILRIILGTEETNDVCQNT